jgi:hypothetical protein
MGFTMRNTLNASNLASEISAVALTQSSNQPIVSTITATAAGVLTVTTPTSHNLITGQIVSLEGFPAPYGGVNGTTGYNSVTNTTITSTTDTTFTVSATTGTMRVAANAATTTVTGTTSSLTPFVGLTTASVVAVGTGVLRAGTYIYSATAGALVLSTTPSTALATNDVIVAQYTTGTADLPTVYYVDRVTYNTKLPHNFRIGQPVTVTGLTTNTAANIVDGTVANVDNNSSGSPTFIAYLANNGTISTATTPTVPTSSNTVPSSIAVTTNRWADLTKLLISKPDVVISPSVYFNVKTTLTATTGTYPTSITATQVPIILTWGTTGLASPSPTLSITGAYTTTPATLAGFVSTNLSAGVSYSFTYTAFNLAGTYSSSKSIVAPKKQLSVTLTKS